MYFFFNDTATTEIYTLSLHDALPISAASRNSSTVRTPSARPISSARFGVSPRKRPRPTSSGSTSRSSSFSSAISPRSEEHTSELQSRQYLVCRLLLEKKNKIYIFYHR